MGHEAGLCYLRIGQCHQARTHTCASILLLGNAAFFSPHSCCTMIFLVYFVPFAVILHLIWLVQAFFFLLTALTMSAVVTQTLRKSICISMVLTLAMFNFKVIYAKDLDPPCHLPFRVLKVHHPPECPIVCSHLEVFGKRSGENASQQLPGPAIPSSSHSTVVQTSLGSSSNRQ